jgi:hypothetical protein
MNPVRQLFCFAERHNQVNLEILSALPRWVRFRFAGRKNSGCPPDSKLTGWEQRNLVAFQSFSRLLIR